MIYKIYKGKGCYSVVDCIFIIVRRGFVEAIMKAKTVKLL